MRLTTVEDRLHAGRGVHLFVDRSDFLGRAVDHDIGLREQFCQIARQSKTCGAHRSFSFKGCRVDGEAALRGDL